MRRNLIHIILFVLTVASTWLTGGPYYSMGIILHPSRARIGPLLHVQKVWDESHIAILPPISTLPLWHIGRRDQDGEHRLFTEVSLRYGCSRSPHQPFIEYPCDCDRFKILKGDPPVLSSRRNHPAGRSLPFLHPPTVRFWAGS